MPEGPLDCHYFALSVIPDEILDYHLTDNSEEERNDVYSRGDQYAPPSPLIDLTPSDQDVDYGKDQMQSDTAEENI